MNSYLSALKKYAVFNGRARRKEYWMFFLFNTIFAIVAMVLDNLLHLNIGPLSYGYIYAIYVLAILLPSLSVLVRRLHDIGKSGLWVFIGLIPLIGGIWLFVLICLEGTSGTNKYGEDPKQVIS